jgi:hypothetical protein
MRRLMWHTACMQKQEMQTKFFNWKRPRKGPCQRCRSTQKDNTKMNNEVVGQVWNGLCWIRFRSKGGHEITEPSGSITGISFINCVAQHVTSLDFKGWNQDMSWDMLCEWPNGTSLSCYVMKLTQALHTWKNTNFSVWHVSAGSSDH